MYWCLFEGIEGGGSRIGNVATKSNKNPNIALDVYKVDEGSTGKT
jgi:hypothetical protein